MSSASSPRDLLDAEGDGEIARLADDPADDDANSAPTKVGPMSKAFVDQMMFKAQLTESGPPSARAAVTEPPASAERSRDSSALAASSPAPAPASQAPQKLVVLSAGDDALPFEPTVLVNSAPAKTLSTPPSAHDLERRAARFPAAQQPVSAPPPAQVLPVVSGPEGSWSGDFALSGSPHAKRDRRVALAVAVVLGGLALIVTAVVVWLFP
jgi:hypothetical protein